MAKTPNIYDGKHPDVSIPQIGSKIEEIEKKIGGGGVVCPFPVGVVLPFAQDAIDPNELYKDTTWEIIGENCYLMGVSAGAGQTGGSNSVTLQTANLPPHNHGMTHSHEVGSHTHSFSGDGSGTTSTDGSHTHRVKYDQDNSGTGAQDLYGVSRSLWSSGGVEEAGSHDHTVSVSVSGTTGDAGVGYVNANPVASASSSAAAKPNTDNTGSGQAISIQPSYYSVILWQRTA